MVCWLLGQKSKCVKHPRQHSFFLQQQFTLAIYFNVCFVFIEKYLILKKEMRNWIHSTKRKGWKGGREATFPWSASLQRYYEAVWIRNQRWIKRYFCKREAEVWYGRVYGKKVTLQNILGHIRMVRNVRVYLRPTSAFVLLLFGSI